MDSLNTLTLFFRHNRPLHTLWLESQAWFCAHELGRLSGHFFDEHCMRKLDPDQYRTVQLLRYDKYQETTMVSESGAYTLLAHHHVPENRHLRWWLTHEVVAVLRDRQADGVEDAGYAGGVGWGGGPAGAGAEAQVELAGVCAAGAAVVCGLTSAFAWAGLFAGEPAPTGGLSLLE